MKILKTLSLVIFWTLGYRILGFIREVLIAKNFGASIETDAYFIAQSLPNLIIEVFAIGALTSAMLPIFLELKKEPIKFKKESNIIIGNFLILSIITIIIILLLNKSIINLVVPGFSLDTKILTYKMNRISIFIISILVINEVFNVLLNCYGEADKISFSHFIYNFSFLIVSIILSQVVGIYGFIFGMVFSSVLRIIYIYNKLKKHIGEIKMSIDFKNKTFIKLIKLLAPIILSSICIQINFIVDRMIGSKFEKGSISFLIYSDKIIQLPLGIILGGVVLTTFPILIDFIEKKEIEKYQVFIKNKIELIFIIMGMISSFVFCFPEWLLSIIFQRGNFTLVEVLKASEILKYYSFSIFNISFITLFQKIFYALKITKLPTYISIISVIINIVLNIILSKKYGIKGIALATMMANLFNSITLFIILKKKKYNVFKIDVFNILKLIILNGVMIIIGKIVGKYLIFYLETTFIKRVFIFLMLGLSFTFIYMFEIIFFYPYKTLLYKNK